MNFLLSRDFSAASMEDPRSKVSLRASSIPHTAFPSCMYLYVLDASTHVRKCSENFHQDGRPPTSQGTLHSSPRHWQKTVKRIHEIRSSEFADHAAVNCWPPDHNACTAAMEISFCGSFIASHMYVTFHKLSEFGSLSKPRQERQHCCFGGQSVVSHSVPDFFSVSLE